MRGHADRAVADDGDRDAVAQRDAIDLVLDRTGIGIDPDHHDFIISPGAAMPFARNCRAGNGGPSRNRTGVQGFAVLCVTTPPSGHRGEGARIVPDRGESQDTSVRRSPMRDMSKVAHLLYCHANTAMP